MTTPLSDSKTFAIEVLDLFDELAKPELKYGIMKTIWNIVKKRTYGIILKKPDEEISKTLLLIHSKLNKRFKDIDSSIELNVMENINPGISIPNVGELGKAKKLTTVSKEQAEKLWKEIF